MQFSEILSAIVAIGAAFAGGVIGGVITGIGKDLWLHAELDGIKATIKRMHLNHIAPQGASKRAEQAERTESAMGEAMILIKGGKPPADALKEVAAKYPDVALRLGKKMMQGKLPEFKL